MTQLNVAISNFHGGQMVTPIVDASTPHAANAKCTVKLRWFDASDRTYSDTLTFTGTRDAAERWLAEQGVHLDAQGIY